jgi:hypothetical protein
MSESSTGDTAHVEVAADGRTPTIRLHLVLWVGLIAAAGALRLARLEALPLTFDEAGRAFDALRVSQNSVPEGWSGDLSAALTSYLFRVVGDSDFVARVVPALAGWAMIVAVWLSGRALGRTGALTAGILLAFSPLAVLLSRSAVPFGTGGLLAVVMMASLFWYVRDPRAPAALIFAVAFGLAPSTDVVATTAAIAVVAFLSLELIVSPGGAVARAWSVFRRSPSHWLSVILVLVAALELGITHFGTSLDRLGLAGLSQWSDMFALPRDGRQPEYQVALLLAYEWPIVLAGAIGAAVFGQRLIRRGASALTSPQRFVLTWTTVAALSVALATQREVGQLLVLIVPLALMAGLLAEEIVPTMDWAVLRRWWPAAAGALVLLAYAALLTSEWSETDIRPIQRLYLVLALGGAAVLLSSGFSFIGRDAAAIAVVAAAAMALAFLAHTNLSLTRNGEATEFAVDIRTAERIGRFQETVAEFAASRAGPILVDPGLGKPLSWYLRDIPVAFARPEDTAGAVVVPAGSEIEGFTRTGEVWRLGEGWYPTDLEFLPLWRWFVEREPYGNPDSMDTDAEILVPAP